MGQNMCYSSVPVSMPSYDASSTPVQGALLNEMPFPSSYIANCRLCLGTKFGDRSTTIVNEQLVAMMRQVFPIVIVNQIGLPMNVCTECVKKIEAFYTFSSQVLTNQKKLQEPSTKQVDKQVHDNERVKNPYMNRGSLVDIEQEIPIDVELLIKMESDPLDSDPLATVDNNELKVVEKSPIIKIEEELPQVPNIKSEVDTDLQKDVKEEILIYPPEERLNESAENVQDPLCRTPPKKRSKTDALIRVVKFKEMCSKAEVEKIDPPNRRRRFHEANNTLLTVQDGRIMVDFPSDE